MRGNNFILDPPVKPEDDTKEIMKKVIVASLNPVKINTTKEGFQKAFRGEEQFEFEGTSVPSGVSDQPMSEEETYEGALNRVKNAQKEMPEAGFWVGIEGGLEEQQGEWRCFAIICILDKTGKVGSSSTGYFVQPQRVMELVKQGHELGDADDIVFGDSNSKQKNGSVGILTKDVLTRETFYTPAIILALIPFLNPELY